MFKKGEKINMKKKDIKIIIDEIKKIYESMDRNVPFKLHKKIIEGGIFTSPTYEYKSVHSWTDMVEAEENGWLMENPKHYAINLAQKNRVAIEVLLEVIEESLKKENRKKKK